MYILNITKAIKKFSVNEITDFIFETYYKRIGFSKKICHYSMKWWEKKRFVVACKQIYSKKIPHSRNSKEHYQSFIRKKNAKSVRQ